MDQVDHKSIVELENILIAVNFSHKVTSEVLEAIKNRFNFIESAAIEAYDGEIPNFKLCEQDPFTRLSILCFKLIELKQNYNANPIPESVFIDSVADLKLRQELYFDETKSFGLSIDDSIWLRHLFNMHLFKLNSLQFQIFEMKYLEKELLGEEYMVFSKEQKESLPADSPVINVHIQDSADLSPIEVEKSFRLALVFFNKHYPTYKFKAFVCYSWLLYSKNKNLLAENSNILKFVENFTIISEVQDQKQALESMYGKSNIAKDYYPMDTSLQRMAFLNLNYLGYACGIIEIEA